MKWIVRLLSRRERQVAELIAQSKSDREIAEALGLSRHTVRGYTKTVLLKLGAHKRTAVAGQGGCSRASPTAARPAG